MSHMADGSIANDSDFILYEDSNLYHISQPHYTSTTELIYESRSPTSAVDYTAMLSGEDSDIPSAASNKIYSLSDSSAAPYQSQRYCLPAHIEPYNFPSYIPRTIETMFSTSTADEITLPAAIEQNPRFLIHAPTFPSGFQIDTGDHRSNPSASPATSIGGFEGAGSAATHSSIHSVGGSIGSAGSSIRGSPYSVAGDFWDGQEQGYCFIDPGKLITNPSQQNLVDEPASSVASPHLSPTSPRMSSNPPSPTVSRKRTSGRLSPFGSGKNHSSFPYPPPRRDSIKSTSSSRGSKSPLVDSFDDERMPSPSSPTGQQAGRDVICPECGKSFRDMKAHLLTHKMERPEKCPIATCEYSKKGFARKYDCQRHTLTHYKGTMVCGFCPCAGSPAEKSFNRADVFKRHLMTVHNVEQQPPNGRKKTSSTATSTAQGQNSPTPGRPTNRFGEFQGTGKCSTCSGTFSTAQHFYEHLDDCVYSKVVQEEPAAAFNEMNLSQISLEDIPDSILSPWKGRRSKSSESDEKLEEDEDDDEEEAGEGEDDAEDKDDKDDTWKAGQLLKPNGKISSTKSKGVTVVTSGVKRGVRVRYRVGKITARDGNVKSRRRGSKKRKNFPAGWGCSAEQMVSKRRCLLVYDGPNILCKDEMMMNTEWEVRASTGGDNYVSDLDFWTMEKAHAALDAGPNVEVR